MLSLHGVNKTNNNQLPRAGRVIPAELTMKYEDIKAGETYNVRVIVGFKNSDSIATLPVDENGKELNTICCYYATSEASAFSPIVPENGIKNTEIAPKYDPCRKFREGDIVRLVEWNGRKLWDDIKHLHRIYNEKGTFTVHDDEQGNDVVIVPDAYTENVYCACPACLELVTPVEELEPYRVGTGIDSQLLYCNNELFAEFEKAEEAKRVCDLLNAEHRKEKQK